MSWPLPKSWEESATKAIMKTATLQEKAKQEKKQKIGLKTPNRKKSPIYDFKQHIVRDKYYQVIGHHYVLDLCRIAFAEEEKKIHDEKEILKGRLEKLINKLAINHTQLERWLAEKTFIEADNFFAYSLLIMGRTVQSLPLCSNHVIVGRAVPSVLKFLASRYDKRSKEQPQRHTVLLVIGLMDKMVKNPSMMYDPHNTSRARQNQTALRLLAESYVPNSNHETVEDREKMIQSKAIAIQDVLTNWGLAYSLFVMGRHVNWNEGGMS